MKEVNDEPYQFSCKKDEIITVEVKEKNTNWLVVAHPASSATLTGKTFKIKLAKTNKSVTFSFDFSSTGGSYDLIFNGSADDYSYTRNVTQTPNSNPPLDRTFLFFVS